MYGSDKKKAGDIRQKLDMPSVYFNLAVHDATAGIRTEWTRIKKRIQKNIITNEGLNEDDRHYLRFVMKMTPIFSGILNGCPINVDALYIEKYKALVSKVNSDKLNRYLCRQVRKQNVFVERQHSYINHELNRFIESEKPDIIYLVKLPRATKRYVDKRRSNLISLWQRGYIRNHLMQKCSENAISIVDVYGKDIANTCSICGGHGTRENGLFVCNDCGIVIDEKTNTAKNTLERGLKTK